MEQDKNSNEIETVITPKVKFIKRKGRTLQELCERKIIVDFDKEELVEAWNSTWDSTLGAFCSKYRLRKGTFIGFLNNKIHSKVCDSILRQYLVEKYTEMMKDKAGVNILVFIDTNRLNEDMLEYLKNINCHVILFEMLFETNKSLNKLMKNFSMFFDIEESESFKRNEIKNTLYLMKTVTENKFSTMVKFIAEILNLHIKLPIHNEFIFVSSGSYIIEMIKILERDGRSCRMI